MSVGVPVYNGEEFLAEALEGVLRQDFRDLEVVISDNGSTDGTQGICERYAAQDERVRYLRSDVNRGLAWNFNTVFHEGRGEFFMWNAADDVRLPGMVGACVAALDADPGLVLAHTRTTYVDERSRPFKVWPRTDRATQANPSERFGDVVLHEAECFPAHGVIRRSALLGTALHGGYPNSDNPLLAELALRGRFLELDEELFHRRDHPGRSMRAFTTTRARNAFFDPRRSGKVTLPRWRVGAEYARGVHRAPLPQAEKARCYAYLGPWAVKWRGTLARNLGSAASQVVAQKVTQRRGGRGTLTA
ncbi:glycosyltransferase family 2 protein [Vallicoccus soli]|uniref:glycosyltransferase family 2 protein n=1 Tax=Vallicoccus soli TaxID=2339232 RepID=UPI00140419DA|nr:glycosyltransferase family 2 protein [Vallicoccus soli]